MNTVKVVGPEQIHRLWSEVENWLKTSIQLDNNECTIEQLKGLNPNKLFNDVCGKKKKLKLEIHWA